MIITQTPLRISFAGGGTDLADYYRLCEGMVVNAAIDKSVFVIVSRRHDDKLYVNYSKKEIVDHVNELEHELVREAMKMAGLVNGIEVTMLSDIPSAGTGLGSSSSFTVGLLNAFHVFQGHQVGPKQLAEEACEIEIARCGKPIGKQDQYIAAYGGICAFHFRRDDSVGVRRLRLSDCQIRQLSSNLFLFYTELTRKADTILSDQRSRTAVNIDSLSGIKELAESAWQALESNSFDRLGDILAENWRLKKCLAERISNGPIEAIHQRAMDSGATGAKVCGAGGGGFLLAYCPPRNHERLQLGMLGYRWMPANVDPDGSKVIFNYRRPFWK